MDLSTKGNLIHDIVKLRNKTPPGELRTFEQEIQDEAIRTTPALQGFRPKEYYAKPL